MKKKGMLIYLLIIIVAVLTGHVGVAIGLTAIGLIATVCKLTFKIATFIIVLWLAFSVALPMLLDTFGIVF